jgi:23S rRNA pseudouridine1911/1915/1917 synthase
LCIYLIKKLSLCLFRLSTLRQMMDIISISLACPTPMPSPANSKSNANGNSKLNQGWCYQEQVPAKAAGMTVGDYYSQNYRHSQPAEWHNRILAGQVLLNQHPTTPDTLLQAGQWLSYHRPPWQEPEVPLDFAILYEDEDLWVISKPAGLPVLPGGGFLQHTLLWQLQQQYPSSATQESPTPIHRLGRGTSGVMLLARTALARSRLSQLMRQHTQAASMLSPTVRGDAPQGLIKIYRALVGVGEIPEQFICNVPIGKIAHPQLGYLYAASDQGKPAHSAVQVLQRRIDATLLEVTIATGRPHQIRIHLAAAGFPLLGDPLYQVGGIPKTTLPTDQTIPVPGDCGYWLHAHQLHFYHPRTGERLEISSPPPPELQEK